MYAVFGSVITQLAEKVGGSFVHFPLRMMRSVPRESAVGVPYAGWSTVVPLVGLFCRFLASNPVLHQLPTATRTSAIC